MPPVSTVTQSAAAAAGATGATGATGPESDSSKPGEQKSALETTKATEVAPSVALPKVNAETPAEKKKREEKEFKELEEQEAELDRQLAEAKKRNEAADRLAKKRAELAELSDKTAALESQNAAPPKGAAAAPLTGSALAQMREEIARGEAIEREAAQAGHEARESETARQAKINGDAIDYEAIRQVGERAEQKVRGRPRGQRGPGVYILSPLDVMGPNGRVTLPRSSMMPHSIANSYDAQHLAQLEADGVIEDLR